jgi:hypothetical protein
MFNQLLFNAKSIYFDRPSYSASGEYCSHQGTNGHSKRRDPAQRLGVCGCSGDRFGFVRQAGTARRRQSCLTAHGIHNHLERRLGVYAAFEEAVDDRDSADDPHHIHYPAGKYKVTRQDMYCFSGRPVFIGRRFLDTFFLGYNLSLAVWVGIIALAGLDAETGVIMLLYLDHAYAAAKKKGAVTLDELKAAIDVGAVKRVRPKIMTAAVIIGGLIPIMWSHGTGSDVMQRIAAPMIGGVVTSVLMELMVYPAIFFLWKQQEVLKRTAHSGNRPTEPVFNK